MKETPRVAAVAAAVLISLALAGGVAFTPTFAQVLSTQDLTEIDEAPTEVEPEPEATPDLSIPSACRGFTTMGNKELWDTNTVIDPVSKSSVDIGDPINWRVNPKSSRSWPIYLHGLAWARGYAADYLKTGDARSLDKAISIVRSHNANVTKSSPVYKAAWKDHPVSLRLTTLACLAAVAPLPSDLIKTINELARWQMNDNNYFQRHNHGLMQNTSLIRAGCQQGQTKWLNTAWRRMKSDFEFTINSAGVNNEQATGYAFFNWRAWAESLAEIDKCPVIRVPGSTLADFQRRLTLLETFNAHATQPDGLMVPIGDTLVNRIGLTPTSETATTAVYQDGYAFGRSAWDDPEAMHWSLRFGPKANRHGHDDHLGVTYFVKGRRVLVDGSHAGYDRNSDRAYLISKSAHNTPSVVGFTRAEPRASQLISSYVDKNRVVLTVKDSLPTAKSKRETDRTPLRTRTLVTDYSSNIVATFDRAQGSSINVPWTFAPDLALVSDQVGFVTTISQGNEPKPAIHFFNPASCAALPVTLGQARTALGWRELVIAPRAVVTGDKVVSFISPGAVTINCLIEQGTTRFQVIDEKGLETNFFFDAINGLR